MGRDGRARVVGTAWVAISQVLRTFVLELWLPLLVLVASESQGERGDALLGLGLGGSQPES